jgi:hypothetical protein
MDVSAGLFRATHERGFHPVELMPLLAGRTVLITAPKVAEKTI